MDDRAVWQLPGLWFTADELRALLTMDRLLADLEPGVLSELLGAFRKRLCSLLASSEHSAEEIASRIRVLSMGARWVSRETWHPEQDGKLQLDGSYLLTFPYSREPELVMEILKYGADVQVLAPASLRKAVSEEHARAAKLYSS